MSTTPKSYWIRSAFYTLVEKFSVILLGFGSIYILLRVFSKEEFGIWALFITVTSLLEVARNGLIQNALIKFLAAATKEEYPKILTASTHSNFLLTLISMGVLVILANWLSIVWESPNLKIMFYIYTVTTFALIPFSQFNFIEQANLSFKGIFWSMFTRQGLLFLYILFYYVANFPISLQSLVIVQCISAFAGSLVAYIFTKPYLQFSKNIDWDWVKKLFHYGKFVFGTNISAMLYKSIDKIMLGALVSTAAVAVYDLAIRINNLLNIPIAAMATIVFPQTAKKIATEGKQAVKHLYEKSVGAILALLIPAIIFILLFPSFIIVIIASDKYLDTVPILRVTALYSLMIPFARQFGTVLDSIGKPKVNFLFVIFGTALNTIFNYIFIMQWGVIGAAYGTLTALVITFIFNQIILYKELDIRTMRVFYHIFTFYMQLFQLIKSKAFKLRNAEL